MVLDPAQLTLAALLTTAGAAALAALVTGLVAVLGRLVPQAIAAHEAQAAAIIAAVFVGLAAVQAVATATIAVGVPLVLAVIIAWYAVTRLAMSIYDDATGQPSGLRAQAGGAPPQP